jgi:Mg-chelatase subunit ChlD
MYSGVDGDGSPRTVELRIERSFDVGGYPLLGDASRLLCRLRRGDGPPAAVITSEQALVRFNRGDALGGGCPAERSPAPPESELAAVYPALPPSLSHPYVQFRWDDDHPDPQFAAATGFGAWFDTDEGRRALLRVGLRPAAADFVVAEPIVDRFGALPGARFDRTGPDRTAVTSAVAAYAAAKRAARVLFALDASGSMARATRDGGTRFAVAVEAVVRSLDLMGARDEFGLMVFSGTATRPLGPSGPRAAPVSGAGSGSGSGSTRAEAAAARLASMSVGGGTPLHASIVAGVDAVGTGSGDQVRALVVLTDGDDTTSGLTAAQVLARVRDRGVRVFVVTLGEASCSDAVVAAVTAASGGGCHGASVDTVDSRLAELFTVLWEGGGGRDS